MHHWLDFFSFIFWFTLSIFGLNIVNVIVTMIISEISWISLYSYTILNGVLNDDVTTLTLSFFMLGLASAEFALIYTIVVLLKNFNKSLNLYLHDTAVNKLLWYNINRVVMKTN